MNWRRPPTGAQLKAWRDQGDPWKVIMARTGYSREQLSRIYRAHTKGIRCCPRCGGPLVREERTAAAA